MKLIKYFILTFFILSLHARKDNFNIAVSTYPLEFISNYLTKDVKGVKVNGYSKKLRKLNPNTLSEIQSSNLLVINGLSHEKWLNLVSLSNRNVIDSTKFMQKNDKIFIKNAIVHSHGDGTKHSHAGLNSYAWMSPKLATAQAKVIKDSLLEVFPAQKKTLESNFTELKKEFDQLDQMYKNLASLIKEKNVALLSPHESYGYLSKQYGFNIETVNLNKISTNFPKNKIKIMLWDEKPNKKIKNQYTIESLYFSLCKTKPFGKNFIEKMHENIKKLKKLIEKS